MQRCANATAAFLGLAACGTTPEERGITGIGTAAGYAAGAPLAGALVGGATGVFTESGDVNLGKRIWKRGLDRVTRGYGE